ncbi:MAG: hypothetical protein JNM27_03280 [Leptospirales bacterium]|nr:hypothetical protein [Leptospirales bacterium]
MQRSRVPAGSMHLLFRLSIPFLIFAHVSCATSIIKKDLGPKNTVATSAAFGVDAILTSALLTGGKSALVTLGYLYGGTAIFLYGLFVFVRPDTRWLAEDSVFETADQRATIELRRTGIAEFAFAEPNSPDEWSSLCRYRQKCIHGYGIHASGWMPLDVSAFEPEGYSGSFEFKGDTIVWNRDPGPPLEFHKRNKNER